MAGLLVLIDGNSLVHRAYHAIPDLTTSDGRPVGAVFGFAQTVLKLLRENPPEYAAVAYDLPGKTFRHDVFPQYKANRPPVPPDLIEQFELVHQVARACQLPGVAAEGFEADDVIATLTHRAVAAGLQVLVVSSDRDCLQLVGDRVRMLSPSRGALDAELFDAEAVQARYGYAPSQVTDAKSLMGDPSDNIPGVPKVGPKTAVMLLERHGSVEEVLKHPEDVPNRIAREYIEQHPEAVLAAKRLATLDREAPVTLDLEALRWPGCDREALLALLTDLEFRSLLDRVPGAGTPQAAPACHVLASAGEVAACCAKLSGERAIGLHTLGGRGQPGGVALATEAGEAWFIPAELLVSSQPAASLFEAAPGPGAADVEPAQRALRTLLEDARIGKVGGGLKQQAAKLEQLGAELQGWAFDPELASYVLEPHRRDHSVDVLAADFLNRRLPPLGKDGSPGAAGAWATAALHLREPMRESLRQAELLRLFDEMEAPLAPILRKMERAGIAVDTDGLRQLSQQMAEKLTELVSRIHEQAGGPFNIESPKQLAEVLFTRLGLPVQKRTKTGPSTDAEVLEKLAETHPIAALIGEYRAFAKLKSTYADALLALAQQSGGRVHTTFEQTVAATGRLSSREPNLQNIPIRTEWGGRIRACFIAGAPDLTLLSADYSQIELRLLAHFSQDPNLLAAFRAGEDIHTRTAAQIFEVPPEAVSSDMRRQAKTVNFAVLYGMGPVALAREIGTTREEAAAFIANYFAKLPGVERYLATTLEQARTRGFTLTIMGRRRAFPELSGPSGRDRSYAERSAINSPLQGSAADIIKVAMVRLDAALPERGLCARLLLQVHDELLLEVPRSELEATARLVKEVMEGACRLDVPLVVETSAGVNWRDREPLTL